MSAPPSLDWLEQILDRLTSARVAVFGDFAVDAYWHLERESQERSLETGKPVSRVVRQNCALGGAGNVAANLVSLGVAEVEAIGLVGKDLFGRELLALLQRKGVNTEGMLTSDEWQTVAFAKPHIEGSEQNRIDFGGLNELAEAQAGSLSERIEEAAERCNVVILNQQVPNGLSPPTMIERIRTVIGRHPARRFLVDSRDRADLYGRAMRKINVHEARRLLGGIDGPPRHLLDQLRTRFQQTVFLTLGERGLLVGDGAETHEVSAPRLRGPVDPVGAGDTSTAALAAVLGAGGDPLTAARVAVLAAAVTVCKLHETGTAKREEILGAARW